MAAPCFPIDRLCSRVGSAPLRWTLSDRIGDVEQERWNSLVPDDRPFLRPRFLKVLGEGHPGSFRFALVEQEGESLAALAFQRSLLDGGDIPRYLPDAEKEGRSSALTRFVRARIDRLQFTLLSTGTPFAPGDPGFAFHPRLDPTQRAALLADALRRVAREMGGIQAWLVNGSEIELKGYHQLRADAEMVLEVDSAWSGHEDYLAALSSKYRVRARKVMALSAALKRRELDGSEVAEHAGPLDALYRNVASRAGFNMATLDAGYFVRMKEAFGEQFRLVAWFEGDRMAGFHTALHRAGRLEAHYIGLDYEANGRYRLYERMLHDLLAMAIDRGASSLGYGRTAPEIKSVIGARAVSSLYQLRIRNPITHTLLGPVLRESSPPDWIPRNPFRQCPDS